MAQDIIADTLNQIMNAKRARKNQLSVKRHSKLLTNVLEIAKKLDFIEDYKKNGLSLEIKIGELRECMAIKPRFNVKKNNIEKYMKRYLPARDIGVIIISTNHGLMTHKEVLEKEIGGNLIAYFY